MLILCVCFSILVNKYVCLQVFFILKVILYMAKTIQKYYDRAPLIHQSIRNSFEFVCSDSFIVLTIIINKFIGY